jgi:hypothetical protein
VTFFLPNPDVHEPGLEPAEFLDWGFDPPPPPAPRRREPPPCGPDDGADGPPPERRADPS